MNVMDTVRAWRILEKCLARVRDPILRNGLKYEYEKRANNEWGYCPAETQTYKEEPVPKLNENEQTMLDRINGWLWYGVDIQTEEEKRKLHNETLANMIQFIEEGGLYWDIPESIQCSSLKTIYDEAFNIVFEIKE